MEQSDCEVPGLAQPDSLFERCSWFYALCREYIFRDHTQEIVQSLFPLEQPEPGMKLLELGCGPGFYACRLSEELPNLHTTGIDLSHKLIERATSRAKSLHLPNCTFQHADAHQLPYADDSVDAIVVSRLFLIVPDKEGVVGEIFRVLKPDGRCFIAEPTSGFRTRMPLAAMWLLSRLTTSPAGKYREPRQADVMSRPAFEALVRTQPWGSLEMKYEEWYQYAVCQKRVA